MTVTKQMIRERAAVEIEERGWIAGTLEDFNTGAVCLLGGLYYARRLYGSEAAAADVHRDLTREIRDLTHSVTDNIAVWNDTFCKDGHEAIALLRGELKGKTMTDLLYGELADEPTPEKELVAV